MAARIGADSDQAQLMAVTMRQRCGEQVDRAQRDRQHLRRSMPVSHPRGTHP
jgi:hypothetical protein